MYQLSSRWCRIISHVFVLINLLQLNQQQNHLKGATTQDYSFLKEASPIYVTSLTGNHVSGTTTVTGTVSNLPGSNCISTPSSLGVGAGASSGSSLLHNNNLQHTATTATPPINVVSTHQVHVHQPPSASSHKLTTNIQVNPTPLAGGWLIGESAQGTLITTNNQQIFQNLNSINNNNSNSLTALANTINNGNSNNNLSGSALNNNNSNINNTHCGSSVKTNSASSVAPSAASSTIAATTTDGSNLTKYYGNTSSSTTSSSGSELLANGHGPRREVSAIHVTHFRPVRAPSFAAVTCQTGPELVFSVWVHANDDRRLAMSDTPSMRNSPKLMSSFEFARFSFLSPAASVRRCRCYFRTLLAFPCD